jgi:hypothetical protein
MTADNIHSMVNVSLSGLSASVHYGFDFTTVTKITGTLGTLKNILHQLVDNSTIDVTNGKTYVLPTGVLNTHYKVKFNQTATIELTEAYAADELDLDELDIVGNAVTGAVTLQNTTALTGTFSEAVAALQTAASKVARVNQNINLEIDDDEFADIALSDLNNITGGSNAGDIGTSGQVSITNNVNFSAGFTDLNNFIRNTNNVSSKIIIPNGQNNTLKVTGPVSVANMHTLSNGLGFYYTNSRINKIRAGDTVGSALVGTLVALIDNPHTTKTITQDVNNYSYTGGDNSFASLFSQRMNGSFQTIYKLDINSGAYGTVASAGLTKTQGTYDGHASTQLEEVMCDRLQRLVNNLDSLDDSRLTITLAANEELYIKGTVGDIKDLFVNSSGKKLSMAYLNATSSKIGIIIDLTNSNDYDEISAADLIAIKNAASNSTHTNFDRFRFTKKITLSGTHDQISQLVLNSTDAFKFKASWANLKVKVTDSFPIDDFDTLVKDVGFEHIEEFTRLVVSGNTSQIKDKHNARNSSPNVFPQNFNCKLTTGAENATDITALKAVNGTGTIDGSNLTAINGTAAAVVQAIADLDTDPANFSSTLTAGAAAATDITAIETANGNN